MSSNSASPGRTLPPKPWEHAESSSGPAPFKPPSTGSTGDVVEASGTAKAGEVVSNANRTVTANQNTLGRHVPSRPWQQNFGNSPGGYGSNLSYNSGFGSGMYGSYGEFGGSYGRRLYGNNMYSGYRGLYGGPRLYGGSMYNSGYGGPMAGYGMGFGGPYDNQDPNNPHGRPSSPPGFWISFIRVMQGVVNFFGRISILIDQNTQAFHMFMTALLQLFDLSGMLYGELARFVLRILGIRRNPKKQQLGPPGPAGPEHLHIEGPKPSAGSWDNVWGDGVEGSN